MSSTVPAAAHADRLPLGIRLIDALMKRNPDFSVEHMDADKLARIQATSLPEGFPASLVLGSFLGYPARGVRITTTTYDAPHGPVPLRVYTPSVPEVRAKRSLSVPEVRAKRASAVPEVRAKRALSVPEVRAKRASKGRPPDALPIVLNIHGGGFSLGSARQGDWLCTRIARDVGAVVVSVDYRLAPTHRFPAAVEDCYGALRWVHEHAGTLGGDASRLGVMGDSAGGNLAAVCAIQARDDGLALSHQALIYPATDMTDAVRESASYASNTRGIILSNADLEVFHGHYLPEGVLDTDWRISPLHAPDLSGLPPAVVVVAGLDPLHDSGVAYAAALVAAGVKAHVEDFHVMPHGFMAFPYFAAGARPALRAIIESQRAAFAPVGG